MTLFMILPSNDMQDRRLFNGLDFQASADSRKLCHRLHRNHFLFGNSFHDLQTTDHHTMVSETRRSKVGSACQRCRRQKLKVFQVSCFGYLILLTVGDSATFNAHARYVSVPESAARRQINGVWFRHRILIRDPAPNGNRNHDRMITKLLSSRGPVRPCRWWKEYVSTTNGSNSC